MSTGAGQQQWTLNEDIENNDAKNADADYADLLKKPLNLDGVAQALGGIGALSIADSADITKTNIAQEQADKINSDNIDWGDAFGEVEVAARVEGNAAHEIKESLGGSVSNVQKNEKPEESIEQASQIVPEGEYITLFKNFLQQGNISPEDLNLLTQVNITSDNYHETIASLDISSQKKTEIISSLDHLNNPERIEKGKLELHKEFSGVFEPHMKTVEGSPEWKSHFHGEAFEKIAEHYMGGNTKTPGEKKQDFRDAMTMAADDLGKRAQISLNPSNTEFFNTNLKIAKNPDSSEAECFDAIANISQIVNKTEGVKGRTKLTEQMRISGRRKLEQGQKYTEFQEYIASIQEAREIGDSERIQQETLKLGKISDEAELTPGELTALGGGKADVMNDTLGQNPTESA